MKHYEVTGMSCAACSARVEKAVSAVEGVSNCTVNLLTNSMSVEGTASDENISAAVIEAGYGIKAADGRGNSDFGKNDEINTIKRRLLYSVGTLAVLMYISMGYSMWGFPLPEILSKNPMAQGLLQLILTVLIMIINQRFFISGFKAITKRTPNMDTLVALGSGAAFVYSVYVLFAMSAQITLGNVTAAAHLVHQLYFESAAMILTLITVGKLLETRSKGKTADAIKGLMDLAPKMATVIRGGKEVVVAADTLKVREIFVVRPGERIAADGVVLDGESAVDESLLTGESVPVDKSRGDVVIGSTVNKLGFLKCEVTKTAADNTLAQIIKLVSDTAATKAPIAKVADKVSGVFVPIVMTIAVASVLIWMIAGETVGFALARGISVLVISCPCALGLATPVAIMVGSGVGAKNGILFKTATALEELGKTKIAVLDKTGTITQGKPRVTDVLPIDDALKNDFLRLAASIELRSEHPLAKAIVEKANEQQLGLFDADSFEVHPGNGISATIDGKKYTAGSLAFVSRIVDTQQEFVLKAEELSENGKTPMVFACEGKVLGIIAVADAIKTDSSEAIDELKSLGIRTVMLTGDNEKTARAIAKTTHIDEVEAGVLPGGKAAKVKELMKLGRVTMVGDGINDAPSLAAANVGVAVGAGADIAIDAADVVLMKSSLCDVVSAIKLSRAVLRNIHQNLFWAFIYNIIGIPLAAGVFIPLLGWELNPMFGAAAMSLSSFSVVSNALRLNFARINGKNAVKYKKESIIMEKIIKIEGMMCPHCEANVKNTLETMEGVVSVQVSHKEGTAVVIMEKELDNELLKKVIEDKGYKVTAM